MNISISKYDVLWNYLGYILKFGFGFITLPLVLSYLSSNDLGVWYTFLAVGAFITLLDFGFSPIIATQMAYVWGGATKLSKEGYFSNRTDDNQIDQKLLHKLMYVVRRIYMTIAVLALLLLILVGVWYIGSIVNLSQNTNYLYAWIIYSCSIVINFYYSYWTPLLLGSGKIKESQTAVIIAQLVSVIFTVVLLMLGFGILSLAISGLFNGIIIRSLSRKFFFDKEKIKSDIIKKYKFSNEEYKKTFFILWFNAKKAGIVSVGVFMINQINIMMCSYFFGLAITAAYGLTLQLFNFLSLVSGILLKSYLPLLSEANFNNNFDLIKKKLSLSAIWGWSIYCCGGIIIIFWGNQILSLVGSHTHLLPKNILFIMFIYLFLEFNHGTIFATYLTTLNKVPFVLATLLTGIMISIVSLCLSKFTGLGVTSLVISSLFIQALYNNWKWPMVVLKELNLSFNMFVRIGIHETHKQLISFYRYILK